jgi:ParB/RepB/Spo0J family partition protein
MKQIRNTQSAIRNRESPISAQIPLDRLVEHPDNPNRMSKAVFAKLVRHIEQTGLYEPLIVRLAPGRAGFYQIINGHQRYQALRQLGHENAHVVIWLIDDEQTDVFLATLNRLCGRDTLDKKLPLLRRIVEAGARACPALAKRLPYTSTQLERLTAQRTRKSRTGTGAQVFAIPMVFYVGAEQQQIIEDAIGRVEMAAVKNRSARRSQALAYIAASFMGRKEMTDDE